MSCWSARDERKRTVVLRCLCLCFQFLYATISTLCRVTILPCLFPSKYLNLYLFEKHEWEHTQVKFSCLGPEYCQSFQMACRSAVERHHLFYSMEQNWSFAKRQVNTSCFVHKAFAAAFCLITIAVSSYLNDQDNVEAECKE